MPNQPTAEPPAEQALRAAALERLRRGSNPFTAQVAAVGAADESIQADVPGFAANQMSELLAIIGAYRDGRQRTTVLRLLGERGSGKTHLLYSLRAGLRQRALDAGDETLLVAVDCLSTGTDPIEYLLWQIVNYLLAGKGD